jgi:hypothetical protein
MSSWTADCEAISSPVSRYVAIEELGNEVISRARAGIRALELPPEKLLAIYSGLQREFATRNGGACNVKHVLFSVHFTRRTQSG